MINVEKHDNEQIDKLLTAFFKITASDTERMLALRALTLHMIEGLAPKVYAQYKLKKHFEETLVPLKKIDFSFNEHLPAEEAMARVDTFYLLHIRDLKYIKPLEEDLINYINYVSEHGSTIYAWLLGELAATCGFKTRLNFGIRPFKAEYPTLDIYWITHQMLITTRYFQKPLSTLGWTDRINDLLKATPWLIEEEKVDIGGEVAFCLQAAKKHATDEYKALIEFINENIQPDGLVIDAAMDDSPDNVAHTTAVALVVNAGHEEYLLKGNR